MQQNVHILRKTNIIKDLGEYTQKIRELKLEYKGNSTQKRQHSTFNHPFPYSKEMQNLKDVKFKRFYHIFLREALNFQVCFYKE